MDEIHGIEIICIDCGTPFMFTPGEQKFYKELGYKNPKRCALCRKRKRIQTPYKHSYEH